MFAVVRLGRTGAVECAAIFGIACSGRNQISAGNPNAVPTGASSGQDAGAPGATATAECPPSSIRCADVCTNVGSDPENCGRCGVSCPLEELCSAGACGTTCLGGSVQCDGRCVDLHNDVANCGACGAACNVGEYCSQGRCTAVCANPLQICNGVCTDTTNDPNHCGSCSVACPTGLVCSNGACNLECSGGTARCGDACVSTASDPANCGACGHACGTDEHCSSSVCVACAEGDTSCNGACVNLATDTANCGNCGQTCAYAYNGFAACQDGVCAAKCDVGYAACPGDSNVCATALMFDGSNCGACGNVCAPGAICNAGTCTTCASGQTSCSGTCVDLTSDVANCGACGTYCLYQTNGMPTCVSGTCQSTCYTGYGDCDGNPANGCEASEADDAKNCGTCGHACGSGTVCNQGVCTVCAPGSTACGSTCADLQTDPTNCGACGIECGAGATEATAGCQSGTCTLSCYPGFLDCDGNSVDGCETVADKTHCGTCKTACAAAEFCAVSSCAKCTPTDLGQALPVAINGTTVNASDSFVTTCGTTGQSDVYYSFTAPSTRAYSFALSSNGYSQVIEIQNGTCGGSVLACDVTGTPQSLTLTAKQTVIVIVEGSYGLEGTFTLTVK